MEKNYNYNFENRYNDPVSKVSSEVLNMNSCKESDLSKTPVKDRFYHTTDTNKFFYDWNGKRYQLNILNGGSSDELTKELEKIKADIAKLDPDKIDALEGKVNDAAKKADDAATKANDAASKAQEAASTITDKASMEYVDNKFAEIKSITNVETVENGYTLVLSDGSSLSVKNGVDGAKGDKGEKGDTGETGPEGPQGIQGEQGLPGEKGVDGKDGAAFTYDMFTPEQLASLKGDKGEKGDTGETGPQGEQGIQGEKGADGAKGDTGAAFTYDMFTEEQLAGLKGPKGDKGDTGETGPEGPQGPQGEKGADGKDGAGLTDEDKAKLKKLDSIPDNLTEGTFPTVDDSGNVNDDATAGLATVDKVVAYIDEVLKKKSSEIVETKDYVYISGSRYINDQTVPTPIYTMNCFEIDADALDESKGIEIISNDEIVGFLSDDPTDGTTAYSQLFSVDVPDGYTVELHMWDDDTKSYFNEVYPVETNPRYSQKKYGDKTYDSYIRYIRNSSVDDPTHRYYDVDVVVSTNRWKVVLKKKDIKSVFSNGGTITLVDNTEITEPLALADGKSVTLNLGGKTLTHSGGTDDATCSAIKITNGTLTIEGNGTLDGGSSDYTERNVIWAKGADSKVIIKGGNFKIGEYTGTETGWYDCIYGNAGSTIEIYGGTFENKNNSRPVCLNIQNTGDKNNIIVYGGKFINYDPSTGDDKLGGTFVADGYESVKISNNPVIYEVVKKS